jgi:hypothetical protein
MLFSQILIDVNVSMLCPCFICIQYQHNLLNHLPISWFNPKKDPLQCYFTRGGPI